MSTKKVKGLLKGLRYISKVFDDEQEEPEMQIGYPTDVKHVAHIGWDGPDDNNNNKGPTWMNDFKPNADDDSSPRPDGHIGDEAKGTKQEKINRNKMRVAIPPKDAAASSPAASGEDDITPDGRMIVLAFQAACQYPGKARLVIPKGNYKMNTLHFMGPCRAKRLVIQLFGNLIGPTDMSMLPDKFWIRFAKLNNVILLGSGGTIDGQGQGVWKNCLPKGCSALPPCNVKFDYSNNMVVKGIRSINPKAFHFHVHSCNNMRFENLYLGAPEWSPNTDGIHTSNTSFVKIQHSTIATGDDCISLGHGSTNFDISDITCGPGHGISIGSLGKDDRPDRREKPVRGIRIKRIHFRGTDNGVRIKTFPRPIPNQVHDVYFEDIFMENVRNPIIFDQEYSTKNARTSSHVRISDIHVRNIRGTTTTPTAVNVKCSKTFPCEGLDFYNIDLKYSGTKPAQINSSCLNARPSYSGIQRPAPCRPVYS